MTEYKPTVEHITTEAAEGRRRFVGRLKMIPLIVVNQIWVVAVFNALGWPAAVPASAVTGCWIIGWPKGVRNNVGVLLGLGVLLPLIVGTYGATT